MELKQPELSIYSRVDLNKPLSDVRPNSYALKFGTVKDLCKQYGIKYIQHNGFVEFIGPKSRLQIFVEKLHFSMIKYSKKLL